MARLVLTSTQGISNPQTWANTNWSLSITPSPTKKTSATASSQPQRHRSSPNGRRLIRLTKSLAAGTFAHPKCTGVEESSIHGGLCLLYRRSPSPSLTPRLSLRHPSAAKAKARRRFSDTWFPAHSTATTSEHTLLEERFRGSTSPTLWAAGWRALSLRMGSLGRLRRLKTAWVNESGDRIWKGQIMWFVISLKPNSCIAPCSLWRCCAVLQRLGQ